MVPSLPLLSCESSVFVKENPDRKKKRISLLISSLSDASVYIVDDKGFFDFFSKPEFTSLFQQTLEKTQHTSHNCYSIKNM